MHQHPHRALAAGLTASLILALAPTGARAQEPAPAAAPADAVQSEYDALMKEFEAAQQAFYQKYSTLETEGERRALVEDASQNPNQSFTSRFQAFAEHTGTHPAAASAWMWLLQATDDKEEMSRIADRMLKDFLHAPAIVQFAQFLTHAEWRLGREKTVAALRTIRGQSRDAEGKLQATLALGIVQMSAQDAAGKKEGRALLEEVVAAQKDGPLAARAAGFLFELDRLQVGMLAPEIEGSDSEGQPFRLSDYRGKVVVLDFWGFW